MKPGKPSQISSAPMRAVGYCRVSTERQVDEGISLDAQREAIRRYCDGLGIELVAVETDEGLSAKNLDRPGIRRAFDAIKSGKAEAIVVAKLDRLTRRVQDLLSIVEQQLGPEGASLLSVSERIDTGSASGRMLLTMLAVLAQWERETIAERVTSALLHLRQSGVVLGQTPYGKTRAPKAAGERHAAIVPAPSELAAGKAALESWRRGGSLRKVAAELNRTGQKPRRAARWSPSSVLAAMAPARAQMERRLWAEIPGGAIALDVPLAEHACSGNDERRRRETIRRKMSAKNAVASLLLLDRAPPPELPVVVRITVVQGPRGKAWDGDNAVARAKGVRDEIARWLGVDDREGKGVDRWEVLRDRAREPSVKILILPAARARDTEGEHANPAAE